MSSPSIPRPIPSSKDPPRPSSSSSLRKQSYTRSPPIQQQQEFLSTSPSTTTTTERSNASTNRPKISSRTTSLEPNVHVLNPSPTPSATPSALQSQIETSNTTTIAVGTEGEQPQIVRKFNPFFTLIHDVDIDSTNAHGSSGNDKGTTIHPRNVHYIFSDDDGNEVLESTLLRLSQAQATFETQRGQKEEEEEEESTQRSSSDSSATFRKSTPAQSRKREEGEETGRERNEERVIILDVNEDLSKVDKISSLSPNWQVLNASLEKAPSFDADGTTPSSTTGEERGIMLKISGVSISALHSRSDDDQTASGSGSRMSGSRKGIGEGNGMGDEEMHALMEDFDRKMAVLRGIVGNGGGIGEERGNGGGEEKEI